MGAAAVTTAALESTVTVGIDGWFSFGTEDDFYGYGFNDALSDPLGLATIGSISTNTYVDATSTTRTVSHVLYSDDTFGISSVLEDSIFFGLVGTFITDDDDTFRQIEYNGITYNRADRDIYNPNQGAAVTYWQWQNVSPNGPVNGVREFRVIL